MESIGDLFGMEKGREFTNLGREKEGEAKILLKETWIWIFSYLAFFKIKVYERCSFLGKKVYENGTLLNVVYNRIIQ